MSQVLAELSAHSQDIVKPMALVMSYFTVFCDCVLSVHFYFSLQMHYRLIEYAAPVGMDGVSHIKSLWGR